MRAGEPNRASKKMSKIFDELHPDTPDKVRPGDIVAATWFGGPVEEGWYVGEAIDLGDNGGQYESPFGFEFESDRAVGWFADAYSMVIIAREKR